MGAQLDMAEASLAAVPRMLSEQGIDPDPVAEVDVLPLAGVASDGRSLAGLLDQAETDVQFERIVRSQLQDVGRAGEVLARAVRPQVTHYVRALSLPSCGRCVVLAGKPERSDVAFARHPQCFPAGVVVSGPTLEAAARRRYDGELVILSTASGQKLAITGNHPVLTRRGWLPAHLVQEGDYVVRSTRADGARSLNVPNHDQVPSLVEDVWDAFSVLGFVRVPLAPEDFHGDGGYGEVDIAQSYGSLRGGSQSAIREKLAQMRLARAVALASRLASHRTAHAPYGALPSLGSVGGGRLGLALLGGHLRGTYDASLTASTALDPGEAQDASDWAPRYSGLVGDGVFAGSGKVGGDDPFGVESARGPRWDAPGVPYSMENAGAYASSGADLLKRLAGQVELDGVVDVRRVGWSGHVYSLTSSEGWLSADSLIVSNCDCISVPTAGGARAERLALDPDDAARQMSRAEREKAFTKAGADAIELGADVAQVVNARRGMAKAQPLFGRSAATTTEGTTRSGVAGRAMRGDGSFRRVRLMPETILAVADGPDDARRLLRLYGYLR